MTVVSLTYFLALLLPPAAVEDRPLMATVARSADAGGAPDACRPAPRHGPGAGWFKRGISPSLPSHFDAAGVTRGPVPAEGHKAPDAIRSGPRLLYLLMSLLC
jgi:hypothetical protein